MHKTNDITLGGQLFIIEDDAYRILNDYLESIRRHFSISGDSVEEIMPDIESGLAQHFQERLGENKKYLDLGDVEAVIKEMGTVDDFQEKEGKETEGNEVRKGKRLYRNPDDAVIGGVCSGLGGYFGVDPVFFRILFVVLVLVGGSGILVYLLLWIAVPEARTTAQKLEMSGGALNLFNLSRHLPTAKEAGAKVEKALEKPIQAGKSLFRGLGRGLAGLGRVIRFLLGLFIAGFSLFCFGVQSFITAVFAFDPNSPYLNIPFSALPVSNYYPLVVSLYFSLAIPLIFCFLLGAGILRKKLGIKFSLWGPLLGLWLIAMITFGVYAFKVAPGLEKYFSDEETRNQDVSQAANIEISGRYFVTLEKSESPYISIQGTPDALKRLRISDESGQLAISEEEPEHCGLFCRYYPARLTIGGPDFQNVTVSGRSVVSSGRDFSEDAISLSFAGNSGANLYLAASQADITAADYAQVDVLGGSIGQFRLKVTDYAYISSFDVPAQEVSLLVSGQASAKVSASDRLTIKTSDWDGRYNPIFYQGQPSVFEVESDRPDMIISVSGQSEIDNYLYYQDDGDINYTYTYSY